MALQSGFFTSLNRDRLYKAEFFTSYFSSFIGNGVFPNPSNNLQVIAAQNLNVNVSPGKGWINGHYLRNDANYSLTLAPADGVLNRIDRIVFAVNFDTRNIEVYTKQGALSANPVAPTLTRNATVYELGLADVRINAGTVSITQAQITDLRPNASLCGIVSGTVNQVDVTTLYNQYATQFEQMTAQQQAQFDQFIADLQDILDGDVAANLANRILALENTTSDINGRVTQHTTQIATLTNNNQKATQLEAQTGTNNTKNMTPLNVKQAIDFNEARALSANHDLNSLKSAGRYFGLNLLNAPTTAISSIENNVYSVDWLAQDFHDLEQRITYRRYFYNGSTWSPWRKVLNQDDYDVLFQSVSNGKAQVASAITGRGVPTASDASFTTLANNINSIQTGSEVATGTYSATTSQNYNLNGSGSRSFKSVNVTGLDFTPTKIILSYMQPSGNSYITTYDSNSIGSLISCAVIAPSASDAVSYLVTLTGNATITNNGFNMPLAFGELTTINVNWTAIQ